MEKPASPEASARGEDTACLASCATACCSECAAARSASPCSRMALMCASARARSGEDFGRERPTGSPAKRLSSNACGKAGRR